MRRQLKETKAHAKALDKRTRKLGGGKEVVQSLVGKATAVAKGPLHAVRGDGAQERMLKNAKTQFTAEQEKISTYLALETFAKKVGDSDTAKLARDIRRDEEGMVKLLEGQIKQLANATAIEDVPDGQGTRPSRPRPWQAVAVAETAGGAGSGSGLRDERRVEGRLPPRSTRVP